VPIEEDSGHWFLMVINIEERKIYQLDPFLTDSKIEGSQQQITKVVCVDMIITEIAF
jgi:Ulp1 family protease